MPRQTSIDLVELERWLGAEPKWEAAGQWYALIAELRIARRVVEAAREVDWALGEPQPDWEPQLYGATCELHDALAKAQRASA